MMNREFADELLEFIKAEPEHLVVLPVEFKPRFWWLPFVALPSTTWLICHASVDENDEYDLRPIAEVIGPDQRLRFADYHNPVFNLKERSEGTDQSMFAMRDGSMFAVHAAPQAIEARLRKAEHKRNAAEDEIDWLTRLAEDRRGQIERGEWPPPRKENDE